MVLVLSTMITAALAGEAADALELQRQRLVVERAELATSLGEAHPKMQELDAVLALIGPMPIGRLQQVLALKSSTLTGSVDRMEKAGLIRRVRSTTDRRSTVLHPPDWSDEKKAAVFAVLTETEAALFAGMNPEEQAGLLALLRQADASVGELA